MAIYTMTDGCTAFGNAVTSPVPTGQLEQSIQHTLKDVLRLTQPPWLSGRGAVMPDAAHQTAQERD